MKDTALFLPLSLALALTACEDPAANKPKAKVGPAVSDAPASASAPASAAASGATETASAPAAPAFKAAEGSAYVVDPAASKLGFVGSKVTGSHDGGFKVFTANANLGKDDAIEGGSVEVIIDTETIFTDADKLTSHLMSDEFFDVKKYPKATFRSTSIEKGGDGDHSHTVKGNLTLHGQTKSIEFPANIAVDGDTVTVKSEFAINRKEFGMEYPGKPDDLIRDDVVIKLDLKLNKKG